VFASLLAKRRLYSGETGQELLEQQLGSAPGVESVLLEVPGGAVAHLPRSRPEGIVGHAADQAGQAGQDGRVTVTVDSGLNGSRGSGGIREGSERE
jgi:hypothetical protein